jgi:hypothetical protein
VKKAIEGQIVNVRDEEVDQQLVAHF